MGQGCQSRGLQGPGVGSGGRRQWGEDHLVTGSLCPPRCHADGHPAAGHGRGGDAGTDAGHGGLGSGAGLAPRLAGAAGGQALHGRRGGQGQPGPSPRPGCLRLQGEQGGGGYMGQRGPHGPSEHPCAHPPLAPAGAHDQRPGSGPHRGHAGQAGGHPRLPRLPEPRAGEGRGRGHRHAVTPRARRARGGRCVGMPTGGPTRC